MVKRTAVRQIKDIESSDSALDQHSDEQLKRPKPVLSEAQLAKRRETKQKYNRMYYQRFKEGKLPKKVMANKLEN